MLSSTQMRLHEMKNIKINEVINASYYRLLPGNETLTKCDSTNCPKYAVYHNSKKNVYECHIHAYTIY
jgi:hypothetical protein